MTTQTVAPAEQMTELSALMSETERPDLAHHLDVIDVTLAGNINDDPAIRAEILTYAQANIREEGLLIDIRLRLAEQAAEHIEAADPELRSERVAEVVDAVSAVAEVANNRRVRRLEEPTYIRAFALLDQVQTYRPGMDYAVPGESEDPEPVEESPARAMMRRTGYRAGRWLIDKVEKATNREGAFDQAVREDVYEARYRAGRAYGLGISELATGLLERAPVDLTHPEDMADVFKGGIHSAYLRQARYVDSLYDYRTGDNDEQAANKEVRVQNLLHSALEHIGPDTPDAVETLLALYNDVGRYHRDEAILKRAVDVTTMSSHEPETREKRSLFGRVSLEEVGPSPFERRRALLEDHLAGNLDFFMKESPAFVTSVFDLYEDWFSDVEDTGTRAIEEKYTTYLANHTFGEHGRYDAHAFRTGMERIRRFSEMGTVPSRIANEATGRVRQHLRTIRARTGQSRQLT